MGSSVADLFPKLMMIHAQVGVRSGLKTSLHSLSFDQAPSGVPFCVIFSSVFFLVSLFLGRSPCSTARRMYNNVVAFTHHDCCLASDIDRPRLRLLGRIRRQVTIFLSGSFDPDVSSSLTRTPAFKPIWLVSSPLQITKVTKLDLHVRNTGSEHTSDRIDTWIGNKNSISRVTPHPPHHSPTPPLPSRIENS